jgi:alanyl-tRNA synthetase
MGFERILSVLQGKRSNYDTDLFTPIFARISVLTGKQYEASAAPRDVAFRVCADHVRAVTSAFADGALPSNEGRGYVLRRLIRRASRFGKQALEMQEPFLHEVVPAVTAVLGEAFPEMRAREEHVKLLVLEEEKSFGKTLERGLVLFENVATKVASAGGKAIGGAEAYELYATYGFPQDLVELMARERNLGVDLAGWEQAKVAHQAASKAEGKFKQALSAEALSAVKPTRSTYHDEGARSTALDTEVLYAKGGDDVALVLAESPFYAESGGQTGDTGRIEALDKSFAVLVLDTTRMGDVVVHAGKIERGTLPAAGAKVRATVDSARRDKTRKNHTATHLLQKALQTVLGPHVAQQGSYVGPDRLRFDFSHPKAVTPEEIERIETLVNEKIFDNAPAKTTVEDLEAAKKRGVMAMFGEKYDSRVRVLDVGGWSLELCGGTHVKAAGDIGPFVILSERAVQAGVRRIEAVTGPAAVEHIQQQRKILREAALSLKSSVEDVPARIEQLQAQMKEAKKKSAASAGGDVAASFEKLKSALKTAGDARWAVLDAPDLDLAGVRDLSDRAKSLHPKLAVALFGREEGRVPFVIACAGVSPKPLNAGAIAKAVSAHLGGGGGGKPELAQGQGQKPEGVPAAIAAVEQAFREALGG